MYQTPEKQIGGIIADEPEEELSRIEKIIMAEEGRQLQCRGDLQDTGTVK